MTSKKLTIFGLLLILANQGLLLYRLYEAQRTIDDMAATHTATVADYEDRLATQNDHITWLKEQGYGAVETVYIDTGWHHDRVDSTRWYPDQTISGPWDTLYIQTGTIRAGDIKSNNIYYVDPEAASDGEGYSGSQHTPLEE